METDTQNLTNDYTNIQNLDAADTSDDTTEDTLTFPSLDVNPPRKRWFILEIPVLLVFMALYFSSTVYQNEILYQTCTYVFEYNETTCQPLLGVSRETPEAERIEKEVQPYVSRILMARSLLESIIPAFVSLFLGPWSDKFGRRIIILIVFSGYFTGSAILSMLSFIATRTKVTPWLFLLGSVPSVLSGGTCALITGVYCYISDVVKDRVKALRMVLNEAAICTGMMIGNVAGSYIYAATNTYTMFSISTFFLFLAVLYVYFFVPESLEVSQEHSGSKLREFFRFDLVKDLFHTCLARRPNYDRAIIWLTMLCLTLAIFTMEGDSNVTYLFLRTSFGWTLKDYNLFNATRIIVQIVGSIVGMLILRKVFKFSIVSMTLISLACCVLESTVRATAVYWWELYFGLVLGSMRGMMGPMSRAILSHVTPSNEVGKVFALTTSLESVSPLISAPLYTTVYNVTLNLHPGFFNFMSAIFYGICFTFVATVYGIQKSLGNSLTYQAIGSS